MFAKLFFNAIFVLIFINDSVKHILWLVFIKFWKVFIARWKEKYYSIQFYFISFDKI